MLAVALILPALLLLLDKVICATSAGFPLEKGEFCMKCKRMLALLLTTALILVTCTGAFAAPPEGEERKEETVYVIADASRTPLPSW